MNYTIARKIIDEAIEMEKHIAPNLCMDGITYKQFVEFIELNADPSSPSIHVTVNNGSPEYVIYGNLYHAMLVVESEEPGTMRDVYDAGLMYSLSEGDTTIDDILTCSISGDTFYFAEVCLLTLSNITKSAARR